jgi:hypothetical protein
MMAQSVYFDSTYTVVISIQLTLDRSCTYNTGREQGGAGKGRRREG